MAEHNLSADPTHSRWNNALAPRLTIDSGDVVHMQCVDSSGGQVNPASTVEDFLAIDRGRIHALTGPIAIHGAEPGDSLAIEILSVAHQGWGWSSTIPGLGFLKERFTQPSLFIWELVEDSTRSLAPAVVPLRPFCGVMGGRPGRTRRVPHPPSRPLRRQHGRARTLRRRDLISACPQSRSALLRRRRPRRPGRRRRSASTESNARPTSPSASACSKIARSPDH